MIRSIVFLVAAISFSANASCIGEAQINGRVREVKKSLSGCRAFLTSSTSVQTNVTCPLDEGKLYSEGFEVGLVNGHDCSVQSGDRVSGYLVDNGSFIYLE